MSLDDYSMPVHKSFHQADLVLGVQKGVFMLLFLVLVLVSYLFTLVIGVTITLVLYVPCRILTSVDPYMLTLALGSLVEPDYLEG